PRDTVRITYRYLPVTLSLERALNELKLNDDKSEATIAPLDDRSRLQTGPLDRGDLRVGGSKSFAVLIGSGRELELDQALRVSVRGNLTPDVRVTAQLSDENLPFQPEGRSERLEELDEVLIEIEGPRVSATFGDFDVDFETGTFGRYQRVLQGALGRFEDDRVFLEISGGRARGTFENVEIRGAEGKQGPYRLVPREGSAVLVAGSETVWVGGERMRRGESNDYVMDYADGTVTFNPSRPIDSESRIAVDFQLSGEEYRRSYATARGGYRWGDRAFLRGTFFSEGDDADSPEAFLLTDEDRDSLAASGDRQALVPSARAVDEGGDYDTTSAGFFVYAGEDSGAFAVTFRDIGTGRGSYVRELSAEWGREIFVFTGAGTGSYDPVILLPLPASERLATWEGELAVAGPLSLRGEYAVSDRDRNRVSALDDDDNGGAAWKTGATLDRWAPVGDAGGTLSLRWSTEHTDRDFFTLSRTRPVHFDQLWMTPEVAGVLTTERTDDDVIGQGTAEASGFREDLTVLDGKWEHRSRIGALVLSGDGGSLARSAFDAARFARGALWRPVPGSAFSYRASEAASDFTDTSGALAGARIEETWSGRARYRFLEPMLERRWNDRSQTLDGALAGGLRGGTWRTGLTVFTGSAETGAVYTEEERDFADSVADEWKPWYRSRTGELNLQWRRPVSVTAQLRRREVEYAPDVSRGNETSDLARIEVRHDAFGGALRGSYTYEATSEERSRRERILLRAPEGTEADYDSLGNFFPREGTFNLVIREGEPEPLLDLAVSGSVRWEPMRNPRWKDSRWRGVRTETFLRVTEVSTSEDRAALLRLEPSAFQRDATTIRGVIRARQEVRWADPKSDRTAQIRIEREDREVNEFQGRNRDDLVWTVLTRGKTRIRSDAQLEATWERRTENEVLNGETVVDLVSNDMEAGLLLQPTPRLRAAWRTAVRIDDERIAAEKLATLRIAPEFAWNFSEKSRFDGEVTWTRFLSGGIDAARSFLRTRKEGARWRTGFAYDWNRALRSSLTYTGEDFRGERIEQRFRAEMRAFF
ncbi:MAG: hypothetical protein HKN20_00350, partial [Gemmatimonadetes bacterium]|nr:hypothetical protein [Gemmatimonadota bacterium]